MKRKEKERKLGTKHGHKFVLLREKFSLKEFSHVGFSHIGFIKEMQFLIMNSVDLFIYIRPDWWAT